MAPAPASSISKKEGKAKNCLQLSLPSGAKVPTLDAHSKPTVMSPIPQPAFMGSTPHTMLPTLNLEMGGAHPINRASSIQYTPKRHYSFWCTILAESPTISTIDQINRRR
ncbi:hypothetical protein SCP_1204140 [Sparassis crispa]|uniref:Uncharacterized protein n=1 Tax=Sparassis crispa TaxID=139825 RepID=A0A401H1B1_9APHY|nr:hypothetical protein SCP_1204140 [Sparassis crispa]GBE88183.1 hypothetical protein SCP_1204140 [Sparassis crispa]